MDAYDQTTYQTAEGTVSSSDNKTNNALDLNPPTMSDTKITNNHGGTNSPT